MKKVKKSVYLSESFNPAENLGFEEYLMSVCGEDEVIMYLWQNQRTIVVGKHQNPYKECDVANLKKDGIHLVRRKSGGGAVFHDLGNLNFTFIAHVKNYDQDKHFKVILDGLKPWGINGEQTGRNDITVDGKKFSGNAFMHKKKVSCHHGTLLVDVNMKELGRYLTPPQIKLISKGVDSVRARVVNLKELNDQLHIDGLKETLIRAFDEAYEGKLANQPVPEYSQYENYYKTYSDWQWTIGESPKATMSLGQKFTWGNMVMDLFVKDGLINECVISSDTLVDMPLGQLQEKLVGLKLKSDQVNKVIEDLFEDDTANDILGFMSEIG